MQPTPPHLLSRPPLELDLLRTLMTIADCRSFTGAAARLGRAQSTISLKIKKLEDTLKTRLLVRTGGIVVMTRDGQTLLGYAQKLLEMAERAVAHTTGKDVAGKVRLGTQEDFACRRLPQILSRFMAGHPKIEIEVVCGLGHHVLRDLNQSAYDLVLLRTAGNLGKGQPLWKETMEWVGSPRLTHDLSEPLSLVLYPDGCFYRRRIFEALRRARRKWRIVYTSSSSASVQAAVRAGLGITALASGTIHPELNILSRRRILPELPEVNAVLYRSPKIVSQPAEHLAEYIVRSLSTAHQTRPHKSEAP
jgi:DNA-binding transcriptional LysR family regulator